MYKSVAAWVLTKASRLSGLNLAGLQETVDRVDLAILVMTISINLTITNQENQDQTAQTPAQAVPARAALALEVPAQVALDLEVPALVALGQAVLAQEVLALEVPAQAALVLEVPAQAALGQAALDRAKEDNPVIVLYCYYYSS